MNKTANCTFFVLAVIFVVCNAARTGGKNDSTDVIKQCNETYNIKAEFLQDLNETGSFSDETDKAPMCFIKCYLEKMKIMNDKGEINKDVATAMYQIENDETVDACNNEMISASISDGCAKAYFFVRCIMTASIVDHKENDESETA